MVEFIHPALAAAIKKPEVKSQEESYRDKDKEAKIRKEILSGFASPSRLPSMAPKEDIAQGEKARESAIPGADAELDPLDLEFPGTPREDLKKMQESMTEEGKKNPGTMPAPVDINDIFLRLATLERRFNNLNMAHHEGQF